MIHILIGTKAQFIKVAPVIKELDKRSIPYRLIDTCQHKDITPNLRKIFNIKDPDVSLDTGFSNINSLVRAFMWIFSIFGKIIFSRKKLLQSVFNNDKNGVCLIHGDTLSTLLGLMIAKSCGLKVGHLEAGLRSFDIFNPFPEELIRIITMYASDYLFSPSTDGEKNLINMKVKGKIFNVKANTVLDSIDYILNKKQGLETSYLRPYVVMSIHRFENINSKKRLTLILGLAETISKNNNIAFIMHQPTKKSLRRMKLMDRLSKIKRVKLFNFVDYNDFVRLLNDSEFLVTDGGSIQEESYFLGVPCLIARSKTERNEGLTNNAVLSGFDNNIIENFLKNYKNLRRPGIARDISPSQIIVDNLESIIK